jgi:hypothetical protein
MECQPDLGAWSDFPKRSKFLLHPDLGAPGTGVVTSKSGVHEIGFQHCERAVAWIGGKEGTDGMGDVFEAARRLGKGLP